MNEGDFELDGYLLGLGEPVVVEDFETGAPEWTVQDTKAPRSGRRLFGRDTVSGPTWAVDLASNTDGDTLRERAQAARAAIGAAHRVWRPAGVDEPGFESVLRYMIGGEVRRVYGRPRKFAPVYTGLHTTGRASAVAEFVTAEALHFEDAPRRLAPVTLAAPATGGFTAPFTAPIVTASTGEFQGSIDEVGGDEPTPFVAEISGPVTNPKVSGDGWELELVYTLASDEVVTFDTRRNTATSNLYGSVAGYLTFASRFSDARLRPGPDFVRYAGTDSTGTSSCTLTWRAAYTGL